MREGPGWEHIFTNSAAELDNSWMRPVDYRAGGVFTMNSGRKIGVADIDWLQTRGAGRCKAQNI